MASFQLLLWHDILLVLKTYILGYIKVKVVELNSSEFLSWSARQAVTAFHSSHSYFHHFLHISTHKWMPSLIFTRLCVSMWGVMSSEWRLNTVHKSQDFSFPILVVITFWRQWQVIKDMIALLYLLLNWGGGGTQTKYSFTQIEVIVTLSKM